jgi:hypothetical protein
MSEMGVEIREQRKVIVKQLLLAHRSDGGVVNLAKLQRDPFLLVCVLHGVTRGRRDVTMTEGSGNADDGVDYAT